MGASIAGPTVACWLAKAGANVIIIKHFLKLRTNGQNINVHTTGITVMQKMLGMKAAVHIKIMQMEGISSFMTTADCMKLSKLLEILISSHLFWHRFSLI